MAHKSGYRLQRVAKDIQRIVAHLLTHEVRDQRVQNASPVVTSVQLSPDFAHAKVYVLFANPGLSSMDKEVVLGILDESEGFFRSVVGKQLRLRSAPQVRVYYDDTGDELERIRRDLQEEREQLEKIRSGNQLDQ